jgi:ribosomal-protein-alanine N-acetyltransferase
MDWRESLPILQGDVVTLRELQCGDAAALQLHMNNPAALEYVSPPPSSLAGLERFIAWSHEARRAGQHLTYGVVPAKQADVVGLVQIWPVEPDFSTAEWGFVIGASCWGKGIFPAAARLMLQFAFDTLGVERLEARSVGADDRVNRVLRKLGATQEGTLRSGFRARGAVMDHVMWSILANEWSAGRDTGTGPVN